MSPTSPSKAVVVKKEDKEARLGSFLRSFMDGAAVGASDGRGVLLLARSHESPAVKAVAALSVELGALGLAIHVITTTETAGEAVLHAIPDASVRIVSDPRFLEAHEQLVLDGATSWLGDCMRREPEKRDAFECYAAGCVQTARRAETSFWRIWAVAQPQRSREAHHDTASLGECAAACAENASESGDAPVALTRQ